MVKIPVVLYKILVMGIILLFIGAVIAPTIASDVIISNNHPPVPKIDCMGAFEDSYVEPGQNVSGQIKICNCGDELSFLNWRVDTTTLPTWGTWKFIPESDTNLPQGYCDICSVGVQLTSEVGDYCGKITIYNSDNLTDYCEVCVWFKLRVKATTYSLFQLLLDRFPFLEVFLRAMNLLR